MNNLGTTTATGTIDTLPTGRFGDVAREMHPLVTAAQDRIEVDRTLPPDVVAAMTEAGVFRALLPRSLGGIEAHPCDWLDLVYDLARLNGSVGWIAMIQCGQADLLEPEVMLDLTTDGPWIVSSSFTRIGKAVAVDGGFRVTGRWVFASGSSHARFFAGLAQICDERGEPILNSSGEPQIIYPVFPASAVTVHDTWDGLGLRGTASNDFEVEDVFVEERLIDPLPFEFSAAYRDLPLFRYEFQMMGHSAHALGVARSGLDAFVELAQRAGSASSNRQRRIGKHQIHEIGFARADTLVKAARLFAWDATQKIYAAACEGDEIDQDLMTVAKQANIFGVRAAKEALDIVFDHAATSAVFRGGKLERAFRDVHTHTQHLSVLETEYEPIGKYYLAGDAAEDVATISAFAQDLDKPVE